MVSLPFPGIPELKPRKTSIHLTLWPEFRWSESVGLPESAGGLLWGNRIKIGVGAGGLGARIRTDDKSRPWALESGRGVG